MKPRQASYRRPRLIDEAVELLAQEGDALVLAGGQSLVAALNLRLNAPETLVDINWIPGLGEIVETDDAIVIGALVRHAQTASSAIVARHLPLVTQAMRHVAHPAIRNRGTTCGSIIHADPASEMPACAVALNATFVLASTEGRREVAARDFYFGLYETERRPDELLVEIHFPKAAAGSADAFGEIARRHGDFASVGIATTVRMAGSRIASLDTVAFASEAAPRLCAETAERAVGAEWSPRLVADLAETLAAEIDPMDSPLGSPDVKRRQAHNLAKRLFRDLMEATYAG